jgi:hypothetical protein
LLTMHNHATRLLPGRLLMGDEHGVLPVADCKTRHKWLAAIVNLATTYCLKLDVQFSKTNCRDCREAG